MCGWQINTFFPIFSVPDMMEIWLNPEKTLKAGKTQLHYW